MGGEEEVTATLSLLLPSSFSVVAFPLTVPGEEEGGRGKRKDGSFGQRIRKGGGSI